MPLGGHNRRPTLQVIREGGTPKKGVVLPPSALVEPDWSDLILGDTDDARRVREVASEPWPRTFPVLAHSVGLVGEQREGLVDLCLSWGASVRASGLSLEGVVIEGPGSDPGSRDDNSSARERTSQAALPSPTERSRDRAGSPAAVRRCVTRTSERAHSCSN